jgi:glucose uptake protein
MFIIHSYPVAVVFCIVTMLCWGSWANTQKLTPGSWRFELFYWDYVAGILICSVVFAFTLGSLGEGGRAFLTDLRQANTTSLLSAAWGGVLFNAANILLVAAIAIAGMSVAFPVGIGLALVIGVVVNYMDSPVGDSALLFSGVAMVGAAILLNAYAYRKSSADSERVSAKGLLLSIAAGALMGLFYKNVASSMFPDFTHPVDGYLSPYSAVVLFSLGVTSSNVLFNYVLMKYPVSGSPVFFADYFRGSAKTHGMGVLGGVIWCIGMSFSIIASGKAGPAISYGLGQGATIVAALWGIFVWKEFRDAPKAVSLYLYLMLVCYVAGLALIIAAR